MRNLSWLVGLVTLLAVVIWISSGRYTASLFLGDYVAVALPGTIAIFDNPTWAIGPLVVKAEPDRLPPFRWFTFGIDKRAVGFPAWLFAGATAGIGALLMRRPVRRRHQSRQPCRRCGYDLRGSTTRCPECGTPIREEGHPSTPAAGRPSSKLVFLLAMVGVSGVAGGALARSSGRVSGAHEVSYFASLAAIGPVGLTHCFVPPLDPDDPLSGTLVNSLLGLLAGVVGAFLLRRRRLDYSWSHVLWCGSMWAFCGICHVWVFTVVPMLGA